MKAKVLAIRFSSLGDVVLALRALRCAREGFGNEVEIHFLTKSKFFDLAEQAIGLDKVIKFSDHADFSELLFLAKQLKKENYDIVFDLHSNIRSRVICFFMKSPIFRIRKPRAKEWLLFLFKKRLFKRFNLQPIRRNDIFLKALQKGLCFLKGESGVLLSAFEKAGKDFRLSKEGEAKKKYLAIAPDSAWAQKEWAFGRFVQLTKELLAFGEEIVWLGLKPPPEELLRLGVQSFVGKRTLNQLIDILAVSKGLICNDAGLMHLAESVGTPVAAIFGPTTVELGFAPRLSNSQIIESGLWCRPCSKSGKNCFRLFKPQKCLDLISVEFVRGKVLGMLKKEGT